MLEKHPHLVWRSEELKNFFQTLKAFYVHIFKTVLLKYYIKWLCWNVDDILWSAAYSPNEEQTHCSWGPGRNTGTTVVWETKKVLGNWKANGCSTKLFGTVEIIWKSLNLSFSHVMDAVMPLFSVQSWFSTVPHFAHYPVKILFIEIEVYIND